MANNLLTRKEAQELRTIYNDYPKLIEEVNEKIKDAIVRGAHSTQLPYCISHLQERLLIDLKANGYSLIQTEKKFPCGLIIYRIDWY